MPATKFSVCFCVTAALFCLGALAQEPALRPRVGIFGATPVTLPEVIAQALVNNRDIEGSRIDRSVARFNLLSAKGVFDSRLGFSTQYEKADTPVSSVIGGSASGKVTQKDFSIGPQLSGLIPHTGGNYQLGLSGRQIKTDNSFVTLNPQYPSALTLNITQPLLRGLRIDQNRTRIEIARKNQTLSDEQFRQRVIEITAQAEKAYWDLVFSVRNQEVQSEGVASARQQVASNRRMADQGVLAPIDVVEAETQLATLEQNLYGAQEALTRSENALKALILPNRNSVLWGTALIPEVPPVPEVTVEPLADLVDEALANRPEMAQIRTSREINEVNTKLYKDQLKPQIDVVGAYTSAGLAGTVLPAGPNPFTSGFDGVFLRLNELSLKQGLPPLPPISLGGGGGSVPPLLIGGVGQSFSNLAGFNFPTARIGLQLSFPLRNRVAEANLATAVAETRRTGTRREQLENQIVADVRNSLQGVESARDRLNAATTARRSAEEQYDSEQRKFQAGTSTVFLVLQRQTARINARSGELRAKADLGKAYADLQRATTRTLQAHRIDIASVADRP